MFAADRKRHRHAPVSAVTAKRQGLMRNAHNFWLGATTITIGILIVMMLQQRPERRDRHT